MSGWRDHARGEVVAGPVAVWCCERRVVVWWRDDRAEWQCYAGRPIEDRRGGDSDPAATVERVGGGELRARMRCIRCRLDVQARMATFAPRLDAMAAADVARVELSSLTRLL